MDNLLQHAFTSIISAASAGLVVLFVKNDQKKSDKLDEDRDERVSGISKQAMFQATSISELKILQEETSKNVIFLLKKTDSQEGAISKLKTFTEVQNVHNATVKALAEKIDELTKDQKGMVKLMIKIAVKMGIE